MVRKKETFFKLNGYREIGPFEDYDFLLRAIKMGLKLFNCPEELNYYRINTEGISYKNKIFQHLGSEYIRDNYTRINTITKEEIISYLKSSVGKTHAKEYKNFVVLQLNCIHQKNYRLLFSVINIWAISCTI